MQTSNILTNRDDNIANIEKINKALEKATTDLTTSNTKDVVKKLMEKSSISSEPNTLQTLNEVAQFVTESEGLDGINKTLKKTQELRSQTRDIKEEAARLSVQIQGLKELAREMQNVYDNRQLTTEKIKNITNTLES